MNPNYHQRWLYTRLPHVIKDTDTLIKTNPFSHKNDKILNQYSLKLEVNLNQPTHTHNT